MVDVAMGQGLLPASRRANTFGFAFVVRSFVVVLDIADHQRFNYLPCFLNSTGEGISG